VTRRRAKVEMVQLSPSDLGMLYTGKVDFPVIAYAGLQKVGRGMKFIGAGGLAWYGGRCWLWLEHVDMKRTHAIVVVRWARRMIATAIQLGEKVVWARRDPEPHSEKLLRHLGFTLELVGEEENWKWQA